MCCLFGLTSPRIIAEELRLVEMMSYLSCFRGIDSTGTVMVTAGKKENEYNHFFDKEVLTPPEYVHSWDYRKMVMDNIDKNMQVLAFHSRAATFGAVTKQNAHPFHKGDYIGMHNGTVHGMVPAKSDKTDSEHIYEMMNKEGEQATIDRIQNGAYALVWTNIEHNTLNFTRNKERPLWLMHAPGSVIMWMSEKWMLEVIASKMNWLPKDVEIHELPVHKKLSMPIGTLDLKVEDLTPKTTSYVGGYRGYRSAYEAPDAWDNWEHDLNNPKNKKTPTVEQLFKETSVPLPPAPSATKGVGTHYPTTYPYVRGSASGSSYYISSKKPGLMGYTRKLVGPQPTMYKAEIEYLMDEGCVECSAVPKHHDGANVVESTVFWFVEDRAMDSTFMCHTCAVTRKKYLEWGVKELSELKRGGYIYVKNV